LIARARTHPERELEAAREAVTLAERLGDPTLLASACDARADVATAAGALDEARQWVDRGLAMGGAIHNPYYREGQLFEATFSYLRAGLIGEARRLAAEYDAIASRLTPHQEVHAVAVDLLVETLAGDWQAACALAARAEAASAANRDTPCQFNWRALLMAALAHAHAGDESHARRLEQLALEAIEIGGPATREPALLRHALVRGDREEIDRVLAENPGAARKWDVDYAAARLDALAALGYRDAVEREALPELTIGGYGKPFALRALGIARGDRTLIEQAADAFESLGLAYRAHETRAALRALAV
jgi:hypothetical protein